MKLRHIDLTDLKTSALNVRKHGQKDGADLVPSIKAVGIIQPLLVRPNCKGFEVIAGQRRLSALQEIAKEGTVEPVPCIIMDDGDDAKAIEASLVENIARLPMDAIDQFEAFSALIKQGRTVSDIADHFGVTTRLVNQRLAIANLYSPIRTAYRNEEINGTTLQILTMATTRQQRAWVKLFKSKTERAPEGRQLKNWLFGGEQILTANALFDVDAYKGVIIEDLFGEDKYFADPKLFWEAQSLAIADMIESYKHDGWQDVILLDVGVRFSSWEYIDTEMSEGGKVYIAVSSDGEVTPYTGQLSRADIKKRDHADSGEAKPERSELTKAMQNYLSLHRHAAVRQELLSHQGVALRLCVAQIITGAGHWDVRADRQKANTEAIASSLESNTAQASFKAAQARVMALLDIEGNNDGPLVDHDPYDGRRLDVHTVFEKLRTLDDSAVMEVLTFVVAEALQSGSAMIEGLGSLLAVDMADHWQVDETFFALLRDKQAINVMLVDVGGGHVAKCNLTSTAKAQKQIVVDFLEGNGREQVDGWQPRYMGFPMQTYTERGGVIAVEQSEAVSQHYTK